MGRDRDITFGKADADEQERDNDAARIEADDLQGREDLELQAEVRDLRRTVNELKDIVHEQQQEIENLKNQQESTQNLHEVERFCREDAYEGLSKYQERIAEIWRELPKYAVRNKEGGVTYSLDNQRLCNALAAVDPDQWESGKKVKGSQPRYAREAFEEIAPCRVEDSGSSKKVVVFAEVWATQRPDSVAKSLMKPKYAKKFLGGSE